jgi:hypothetical protein
MPRAHAAPPSSARAARYLEVPQTVLRAVLPWILFNMHLYCSTWPAVSVFGFTLQPGASWGFGGNGVEPAFNCYNYHQSSIQSRAPCETVAAADALRRSLTLKKKARGALGAAPARIHARRGAPPGPAPAAAPDRECTHGRGPRQGACWVLRRSRCLRRAAVRTWRAPARAAGASAGWSSADAANRASRACTRRQRAPPRRVLRRPRCWGALRRSLAAQRRASRSQPPSWRPPRRLIGPEAGRRAAAAHAKAHAAAVTAVTLLGERCGAATARGHARRGAAAVAPPAGAHARRFCAAHAPQQRLRRNTPSKRTYIVVE